MLMPGLTKLKNKKVKIKIDPFNEKLSRYRTHDGKIGFLLVEKEETVIVTLAPNSNDDMILPPVELELPHENVEEINDVADYHVMMAILKAYSELETKKTTDEKDESRKLKLFYSLATESTSDGMIIRLKTMGYDQFAIIQLLKKSVEIIAKQGLSNKF